MSNFNTSIFRSYDIRGVYPKDLDESVAYLVGQALVKLTQAKKIFVGRDMRISGESLMKEVVRGIIESGADADIAGLVPIDFQYWAVPEYGYDAGIVVTASHNPKEYNGFKIMSGEGVIRGIEIREVIESGELGKTDTKGVAAEVDYWKKYLEHILSFVDTNKIKPIKVVIDAGNGMAGKVIPLLEPSIPIKVVPLFFELDGTFPNRSSNPLDTGATDALKNKVLQEKADLGVAFDADTDRLFFIDEKGKFVQADTTLLVLAKYFLEKEPGAGIAYNLVCSKAVPELVKKWGGVPLRSAVGYVNVRKAMKEGHGIMGGEISAHYSFRDNYYADSGFIALLIMLQVLSQEDKRFSEMVKDFTPYCRGPEANFKVEDKQEVLDKLEAKYHDADIDKLDGITFKYKKWWFNARPSNTEPLLRVTVEGDTCKIMEGKREEITEFIKNIAE